MGDFYWYSFLLVLVSLSFLLKPLRLWLEKCADDRRKQSKLVATYQDETARFLRLSHPQHHEELRELLRWTGYNMLQGTKLIRLILLSGRKSNGSNNRNEESTEEPLQSLSEEARHALARALAAALLASSYQSALLGRKYRSMLRLLLESREREIKEPQQIVYRYREAKHLPVGHALTS